MHAVVAGLTQESLPVSDRVLWRITVVAINTAPPRVMANPSHRVLDAGDEGSSRPLCDVTRSTSPTFRDVVH